MHVLAKKRVLARSWRGWALGVTLVLAASTLGAGAGASSLATRLLDFGIGPVPGELPPVVLPNLAGQPVTLAEQRGRVVMLYFWATWCPYCMKELPSSIQALHRDFGDRGLTILAINFGESRSHVAQWVGQRGLTFPVLLDESGAVAGAYRVRATPTVVLVDRRGQAIGRAVGSREWESEGRGLVEAILAERP